jgi:hypothetical protein
VNPLFAVICSARRQVDASGHAFSCDAGSHALSMPSRIQTVCKTDVATWKAKPPILEASWFEATDAFDGASRRAVAYASMRALR